MRGFTDIKGFRNMNEQDIAFYNANNKFRASHEAVIDGEKEYKRDRREMVRNNDTYCNMIGRGYESILKYGV